MAPAGQDSAGMVRTRRHSPTFLFLMSLLHATEPITAKYSALFMLPYYLLDVLRGANSALPQKGGHLFKNQLSL